MSRGEADAGVVILPVPYEATVSYQSGTKWGPRAILEASRYIELYDQELDAEPAEIGIATLPVAAVLLLFVGVVVGRLAAGIPKSDFWASAKEGIDQVGCVYTAQGFEFDCASTDNKHRECQLPVDGVARLVKRASSAPCIEYSMSPLLIFAPATALPAPSTTLPVKVYDESGLALAATRSLGVTDSLELSRLV